MSYKEVNKDEALALLRRPGSEGGMSHRESPGGSTAAQQQQSPPEPLHTAAPEGNSNKLKPLTSTHVKQTLLPAIIYGLTNLGSVVTIVVANKVVMSTYKFSFPVCLTWFHAIVTALGMIAMAAAGMFQVKKLPWQKTAPVACAYVGFVIFNNLSIQVNTVGFYQISKIMITPVVVLVEYFAYHKTVSRQKLCAIALLMFGISIATVSDKQVSSNPLGILVAGLAVLSSSLYQVWTGVKQKQLGVNGNQLLHQVSPIAVLLLAVLVPLVEPVGSFSNPEEGTLLGYTYSRGSLGWILLSSGLGLVVTLSTYLFIGVTSPLTYNVVGHLKTVLIVTSGVVFFGDVITAKKMLGIGCAMAGIVWYTSSGIGGGSAAPAPAPAAASSSAASSANSNGLGKQQQPQQQV
uniref:Sugar phosphate transporter domain-containing protein n=1 Tax=Tetradesmus obliquus TaxID=3088 RepID=A0A383W0N7_TETOB|eukprot:jgi/Sobl393_1/15205/SZX70652.1